MNREETNAHLQTKTELIKLNRLLDNNVFAIKMATHCEAAYAGVYSTGQSIQTPDVLIEKKTREERTAFYLTSLYMVKCSTSGVCKAVRQRLSNILKQAAEKILNSRYALFCLF